MQLYISERTPPEEVKTFFSSCYPFLKIEFYKIIADSVAFNRSHTLIKDRFANLTGEGVVDINNNITVAELGNSLAKLGLRTEVFRKSGNVWVAALLTSNWTLEQQNNAGEELTNNS